MKRIRILTVSNTAWSDDNSFGLTYNALFDGLEDSVEFANIYCNYGIPKNNCVKKYCQITEKTIIENLKNKNVKNCRVFSNDDMNFASVLAPEESKKINNIKKRRFQISLWARDFIWKCGLGDMADIVEFVKEYKPDIIFTPMYYMFHTNRILQTVIKIAEVPVVAYISDDIYRTTGFACSPFHAIDRFFKRKVIKKSVLMCDMLYVACEEQAAAYEKLFGKTCKVLRKPAEEKSVCEKNTINEKTVFIYAGNLGTGRLKTIECLGKFISENGGIFKVYSATPLTESAQKKLEKNGIEHKGYVSSDKIGGEILKADVIVYAEGFCKKDIALTKYSVSTKFSGCLASRKMILAAGPEDIHAIKYLRREKAAIVACKAEDFSAAVKKCMLPDKEIIDKAIACAERDFNKNKIQKLLIEDIFHLAGKRGDSE